MLIYDDNNHQPEFDRSLADEHEHAHFIGAPDDHPGLDHGQPVHATFHDNFGFWYAVHTH